MVTGIESLYTILQEETYNGYGYHGYDDVQRVLSLIIPLKLEQSLHYPRDFSHQYHYSGHHSSHMYHNVKLEPAGFRINAQQHLTYFQMSAATNGQIFCQALDNAQQ